MPLVQLRTACERIGPKAVVAGFEPLRGDEVRGPQAPQRSRVTVRELLNS